MNNTKNVIQSIRKKIPGFSVSIIFLIVFACTVHSSKACSTFVLQYGKHIFFGKNFDFLTGNGMVMINKRNVIKTALMAPPEKPVRWISKYGSITFNQVGKEFPFGGMNEAGLVVEQMWLSDTQYPVPDDRPALNELQWIQYQLDNFDSVDDVIKSDTKLRISQNRSTIHFLVCDREGNAATVEFLNGQMVAHTAEKLNIKALTNSTYSKSLEYLKNFRGFGGDMPFSSSPSSLDRFARIAKMIKDYQSNPSKQTIPYAFDILSSVSQGKGTVWSTVYDIEKLQITFRTFEERKLKTIRLSDFDFNCNTPAKSIDVNTSFEGNISKHFFEHSTEVNRKLVKSTFDQYKKGDFLGDLPEDFVEFLARYPETLKCNKGKEKP